MLLQSLYVFSINITRAYISSITGKTLALVNAHLAAHVGKVKERNAGTPPLPPLLLPFFPLPRSPFVHRESTS